MRWAKRLHLVTERRLVGAAAASVNVGCFTTNDPVAISLWYLLRYKIHEKVRPTKVSSLHLSYHQTNVLSIS